MGVRSTGDQGEGDKAALFDSVTGVALPLEIFETQAHAEDFLEWSRLRLDGRDLRECSRAELALMHDAWFIERVDSEHGFLRE